MVKTKSVFDLLPNKLSCYLLQQDYKYQLLNTILIKLLVVKILVRKFLLKPKSIVLSKFFFNYT